MVTESSDQIVDMLAGIQGRTISEQALRDLVAERDDWKGRAEELSGIEDVSIQQTQRALAAEAERDAAQHAIELAAAALAGALRHTEELAAELVQANDSSEAAEKKAARWRSGFTAECEARAAAEKARDAAVVERDAWGGKCATASHELHLIRHQRNEVVRVLGALVTVVNGLTNGLPVEDTLAVALGRAEQLVALYARAAELRAQEPAAPSEEGQPAWVHVHIGAQPGQNTFASCYRCGALCQPETWTTSLTERTAMVAAFSAEHAGCGEQAAPPVGYGRCQVSDPSSPNQLCTGVAASERGRCQAHEAAEPPSPEPPARCAHGHAGCCGHHDPEDMPLPPNECPEPPAPPSEEGQPT